jgi:hypothetical protein
MPLNMYKRNVLASYAWYRRNPSTGHVHDARVTTVECDSPKGKPVSVYLARAALTPCKSRITERCDLGELSLFCGDFDICTLHNEHHLSHFVYGHEPASRRGLSRLLD